MNGLKRNLSKQMIGARVVFNGDGRLSQLSALKTGAPFTRAHLDAFEHWSWVWDIEITFIFENGKLPQRSIPVQMTTDKPIRLGLLTDLVLDLQLKHALEQPEGYKFKTKTWTSIIKKGAV